MFKYKSISVGLLICILSCGIIIADPAEDMKNLASKNKAKQEEAKKNLISGGEASVDYLSSQIKKTTSVNKKIALIGILKEIANPSANQTLAEIALSDRSSEIRKFVLDYIKKEKPYECKAYLIEKALSKSPSERNEAIKVIKILNDPVYIDDLIEMMKDSLISQNQSGGSLQIDMVRRDFDGWSNYDNSYSYPTRTGTVSGSTPVRMARFKTTSVNTDLYLPVRKILVEITGVDFDYNIAKWMIWRIQKYEKLQTKE